jgi:hypothetical protein
MLPSSELILPHHEFDHLSHFYLQLHRIEKYDFGKASSGKTSTLNFVKMRSSFFEILGDGEDIVEGLVIFV